ncbi:translation initiation factor eIF-1A [Thermoplasmatales archaeon SW_10_69_26]|jgi:translation initiation factor 1A|nr:MAG: translation initiation factor eIF-1A [Thermoplasmatales archaeon SW_10_69_26]
MAEDDDQGSGFNGPLPDERKREMFALAKNLLGGSRLEVVCEDGETRMGRIKGKHKRRMWIREGDLLIVKPWDFQDEKCDVEYRYVQNQSEYLSRRGMIPDELDVF